MELQSGTVIGCGQTRIGFHQIRRELKLGLAANHGYLFRTETRDAMTPSCLEWPGWLLDTGITPRSFQAALRGRLGRLCVRCLRLAIWKRSASSFRPSQGGL